MEMLYGLLRTLIGWPGIITSIVLVCIGIYSKRIWLIILGAIFAIPISWYLGSTPKFRYIMYALPIFFVGSALAIKYEKSRLAWIFVLPYVSIIGWLGLTVLSQ
ncbi:hypothetical protein E4K67_05195 [Desulfosporosinus fructosivorans]|uniref:Uncharacterized protein n=1 Tax=Desulfosporosinus fructosivorans TaxID=2018669 RepID=A0A4Z0RA04_9FIRM|nr:hypothetical protein [Desulfosporosinus fructosivorans]TGE38873.1 hypothetical protein E4K67_05195 [Desulfosporosinus fructosivorans]